jgi:hypothetical protein
MDRSIDFERGIRWDCSRRLLEAADPTETPPLAIANGSIPSISGISGSGLPSAHCGHWGCVKQGLMSLLDFDLTIATLVAFALGLTVSGSWRLKVGICFLVAFVAWGVRALAILTGDVSVAEDYVNGLSLSTGAAEFVVALAWTALWWALGTVSAWAVRRMKASAQ